MSGWCGMGVTICSRRSVELGAGTVKVASVSYHVHQSVVVTVAV